MPITREEALPGVKITIPTTVGEGWMILDRLQSQLREANWTKPYLFIQEEPDVDNDISLNMGKENDLKENLVNIQYVDLYTEPSPYPLPEESFEGNTEDPVNPTHYKGKEVFNQMVALFGAEEVKVFCRLNAYKYLTRAGKKEGNPIDQDVAKALWYLKEYDNLNTLSHE